jgi:hypothetical protein
MVAVGALEIQGNPSELFGWSNGSTVSPAVAPPSFTGQLMIAGNGAVKFAPVGTGEGASFFTCCTASNMAYYQFLGASLGNIFALDQGQISFTLKSARSFAQRQATAAAPRYVFDVSDNPSAGHQLFKFATEYIQGSLTFTYKIGGAAAQFYYVPKGTEDTLFGSGVVLQVALSWANGQSNLYLNGNVVQTTAYTPATASWTSSSVFDLGALINATGGPSNSCDDAISAFTVGVPIP